jgi:hypothetical protein
VTHRRRRPWPDGRQFAFSIIDDTDHATVRRLAPVYALLADLGLFTTKTVWVLPAPEDPHWGDAQTLDDPGYREYILGLQGRGFEIALHGVRGTSSTREVIAEGLARYEAVLGAPPRIHANHAQNADNLYWGAARLPGWRRALGLHGPLAAASAGHDESSPFFWGDLCRERIQYVRGASFADVNTLRCDPWMPYRQVRYPFVKAWFSCSDAARPEDFRRLLATANIDRLAREGGLCIVYTHFGVDGFLDAGGRVEPGVRQALESISRRNVWCRPVGDILDFLAADGVHELSPLEDLRLQLRIRRQRA